MVLGVTKNHTFWSGQRDILMLTTAIVSADGAGEGVEAAATRGAGSNSSRPRLNDWNWRPRRASRPSPVTCSRTRLNARGKFSISISRQPQGAVFWIGGPAGCGKTHFLDYVIALQRQAGALDAQNIAAAGVRARAGRAQ